MKKQIPLILFGLIPLFAMAQQDSTAFEPHWYLGAQYGTNGSSYQSYQLVIGHQLHAHWGVQSGLGYGITRQPSRNGGKPSPFAWQLEVPLYLKYTFGKSENKLRPFIGIGGTAAHLQRFAVDNQSFRRVFRMTPEVIAGVQYAITPRIHLNLQGRWGLNR